jgi:hypothetical protein
VKQQSEGQRDRAPADAREARDGAAPQEELEAVLSSTQTGLVAGEETAPEEDADESGGSGITQPLTDLHPFTLCLDGHSHHADGNLSPTDGRTGIFPGGAKQFLSSHQARALIATIKPGDLVGKARRRLAVELIGELEAIDKKIKTAEKDLNELVTDRGSTLMELHGIGPWGAARSSPTSARSAGSPTGTGSRPGTAPHPSTLPLETRSDTGSPAPGTAGSTGPCTSWP